MVNRSPSGLNARPFLFSIIVEKASTDNSWLTSSQCTVEAFLTIPMLGLKEALQWFCVFSVLYVLMELTLLNRPPGVVIICGYVFPVYLCFLPESWKPLSQKAQSKYTALMTQQVHLLPFLTYNNVWVWLTSAGSAPTCEPGILNERWVWPHKTSSL